MAASIKASCDTHDRDGETGLIHPWVLGRNEASQAQGDEENAEQPHGGGVSGRGRKKLSTTNIWCGLGAHDR